jgi:hypothetical protein
MLLTNSICAAVCACCVWPAASSNSRRPDALVVRVNLAFDQSIPSHVIRSLKHETTAIWNVHGVELLWSESYVEPALRLDVVVQHRAASVPDRTQPALARTTLVSSGVADEPIRIFLDTIEAQLEGRHGTRLGRHDGELATAVGRVLAHEIGHVLLGSPAYHDRKGLMRAAFPVDELVGPERRRFQLTDESAERLRAHIACWSDAEEQGKCTYTARPD